MRDVTGLVRTIHWRKLPYFVAKSEFFSRPLPPEASVALMENFQLGSVGGAVRGERLCGVDAGMAG